MGKSTAILSLRIIGDAVEAVKATREAEGAVDDLQEHVEKVKDGVQLAGAAAGAALVGGFYGAVENAQINDRLAGQLALTPDESERLGRINGDLFAEAYGDSLEQVAEASRNVIGNIEGMRDASDDVLSDITGQVLNTASTFDQDLGGITTAIGQMMRTGLAPDAQTALDIITAGLQGNARAGEDLLDTFTEYPALLERLGLKGDVAMGLINQGLDAGARNTDLVADALKEFQIRATDGSATSAAGFEALGINAADATAQIAAGGDGAAAGLQNVLDRLRGMEDPVARNAAAVALFGTQAEDLGGALFALDPSSAVDALGQVTGAAENLDETVNQHTGLTELGRSATQAFTDIGEAAIPVLMPIVDGLKQFAPVLGPLALVLATVAGAVTVVSGAMKVFAAVQAIQTAAQWASNAAWLASPITWIVLAIIAAIALVIAIIVVVVRHWDTFRDAGATAVDWVGQRVIEFTGWIQNAIDWVGRLVSALWDIATFNFGGGITKLAGLFGGGELNARMTTEAVAAPQMMRAMVASSRVATVATAAPSASSIGSLVSAASAQRGGDTYEVNVSAGVGDPVEIGRQVVKAIKSYRSTTGQLKPGEALTW